MRATGLLFAVVLLPTCAHAQERTTLPAVMKDARPTLNLWPNSDTFERHWVLDWVEAIYDQVWPHLDVKLEAHRHGDFDPSPLPQTAKLRALVKLEQINKKNAGFKRMTDEDFFGRVHKIFTGLHDHHTPFPFPSPHACHYARLPITLGFVHSEDPVKSPSVAVTHMANMTATPALHTKLNLTTDFTGMELVSYNNKTFNELFASPLRHLTSGANLWGNRQSTLDFLFERYGTVSPMPEQDEVILVLRDAAAGTGDGSKDIAVVLPWMVDLDPRCVQSGVDELKLVRKMREERETVEENKAKDKAKPPPPMPSPSPPASTDSSDRPRILVANELNRPGAVAIKQNFPGESLGDSGGRNIDLPTPIEHYISPLLQKMRPYVTWKETQDGILRYGTFKQGDRTIGVLRLDSFVPVDIEEIPGFLVHVHDVLTTSELNQTDALIFDMRGNPGGLIAIAEGIMPMLASASSPVLASHANTPGEWGFPTLRRLKTTATNVNLATYYNPLSPMSLSLEGVYAVDSASRKGERYSAPYSSHSSSNCVVGQAYVNPVVLFVDARCYSSCDMMSMLAQDYQASTKIYGHDGQTGAGGASVIGAGPLSVLFEMEPPLQMYFRSSWQQAVRGNGAGPTPNPVPLLEERGVVVDMIVRPTMQEYRTGIMNDYKKIAQDMESWLPRATAARKSVFVSTENGGALDVPVTWSALQAKDNGGGVVQLIKGQARGLDKVAFGMVENMPLTGHRNLVGSGAKFAVESSLVPQGTAWSLKASDLPKTFARLQQGFDVAVAISGHRKDIGTTNTTVTRLVRVFRPQPDSIVTLKSGENWTLPLTSLPVNGLPASTIPWTIADNKALTPVDALKGSNVVCKYRLFFKIPKGTKALSVSTGLDRQPTERLGLKVRVRPATFHPLTELQRETVTPFAVVKAKIAPADSISKNNTTLAAAGGGAAAMAVAMAAEPTSAPFKTFDIPTEKLTSTDVQLEFEFYIIPKTNISDTIPVPVVGISHVSVIPSS